MAPKRRRTTRSSGKADLKDDKEESAPESPGEAISIEAELEAEIKKQEAEMLAAVEGILDSAVGGEDDSKSPEKAPATPSASGGVPTAVLQSARTRLSGLLSRVTTKNLSQQAAGDKDDSDASMDDVPLSQLIRPSSPAEKETKQSSPPPAASTSSTPKIKMEASSKKRRKKRELGPNETCVFHHTYVMKLFDRSVDLAQFRDNTSLYPVCRAWMANQPRNPNLAGKRRTPTPTPSEDEEEEEKKEGENQENTIKNVYKMPPADPPLKPGSTHRVPSPIPHIVSPILINEEAVDGGKDDRILLMEHMDHWRAVKGRWNEAARKNEQRFEKSVEIIEEIFKKAQEMYA